MPSDVAVHVVDDDVAVRKSLSFLLASDGLPVQLHESASAFLDNLPNAAAGCIVTDVRMPGIDGIELIRRLKDRGIALPIIVITGHADVPMAVEAMKEGAVDFLEKPFSDEVFLATVRAALARQEKESPARRSGRSRFRPGSTLYRSGSVRSSTGWWPARRTRSSPTTSGSARGRWRSTGPTS